MKFHTSRRTWILAALIMFTAFSLTAEGAVEQHTSAAHSGPQAKYVFLFIGDGMSTAQINAAESYANAQVSDDITVQHLRFSKFPVAGLTTTYDASSLITDSASSATAMASGNKTLSGVINMSTGKTEAFKLVSEYAREQGKKIGVVSTVSLNHATPAAFYAKVPSRGNYYDIAVQLTQSDFDYFGGGGFIQPDGKNGDQANIFDLARNAGYTVADTDEEFHALTPSSGKVLAVNERLQSSSADMPYDIDRKAGELSLADYTAKGIELLSDDPDGFFMMVESGKIDWSGHANDAGASIHETLAFDAAVAQAIAFAEEHPDETLIVVTGDHETGGMTIGFAGTKYSTFFDKIGKQKMSFTAFDQEILGPYKESLAGRKARFVEFLPSIEDAFGIEYGTLTAVQQDKLRTAFERSMGNEVIVPQVEDVYLLYGGYEPLTMTITHTLNEIAGIGWTTYSHTGVPVATFAKGAGQDLFGGYYDNTKIFTSLMSAMGLSEQM